MPRTKKGPVSTISVQNKDLGASTRIAMAAEASIIAGIHSKAQSRGTTAGGAGGQHAASSACLPEVLPVPANRAQALLEELAVGKADWRVHASIAMKGRTGGGAGPVTSPTQLLKALAPKNTRVVQLHHKSESERSSPVPFIAGPVGASEQSPSPSVLAPVGLTVGAAAALLRGEGLEGHSSGVEASGVINRPPRKQRRPSVTGKGAGVSAGVSVGGDGSSCGSLGGRSSCASDSDDDRSLASLRSVVSGMMATSCGRGRVDANRLVFREKGADKEVQMIPSKFPDYGQIQARLEAEQHHTVHHSHTPAPIDTDTGTGTDAGTHTGSTVRYVSPPKPAKLLQVPALDQLVGARVRQRKKAEDLKSKNKGSRGEVAGGGYGDCEGDGGVHGHGHGLVAGAGRRTLVIDTKPLMAHYIAQKEAEERERRRKYEEHRRRRGAVSTRGSESAANSSSNSPIPSTVNSAAVSRAGSTVVSPRDGVQPGQTCMSGFLYGMLVEQLSGAESITRQPSAERDRDRDLGWGVSPTKREGGAAPLLGFNRVSKTVNKSKTWKRFQEGEAEEMEALAGKKLGRCVLDPIVYSPVGPGKGFAAPMSPVAEERSHGGHKHHRHHHVKDHAYEEERDDGGGGVVLQLPSGVGAEKRRRKHRRKRHKDGRKHTLEPSEDAGGADVTSDL